jgi:hypothetical protein
MAITPEVIQDHLPYYLTQEAKDGILQELRKFPEAFQYYLMGLHQYRDDMLQGGGWQHLHLRDFGTGEKLHVSGVILSNTCDISPENKRDLPINVIFAPLIPLSALRARLAGTGASEERISAKLDAIRKQHVTNLFYVPAGGGLEADHVVLLDDVHTMPAEVFVAERGTKIFTLSQAGFYLFIIKLSLHFCRFHENLIRA